MAAAVAEAPHSAAASTSPSRRSVSVSLKIGSVMQTLDPRRVRMFCTSVLHTETRPDVVHSRPVQHVQNR